MSIRRELPAIGVGFCATLAAIGLARFAYTPILPALIMQGWFSADKAAYLGAANLLGYLIGALTAHYLSERLPARLLCALAFLAITLSFLLCAQPSAFSWFFFWRLLSGIAGGLLMVIGPSMALAHASAEQKSTVASLVFTGIGCGVLLSATCVPLLLRISLPLVWIILGVLALLAGLLCDRSLARLAPSTVAATANLQPKQSLQGTTVGIIVVLILVAYAMDGGGFVPHTLFWVDYLQREVQLPVDQAAVQWGILGLGALSGPLLAGLMVRHLGWQHSLSLGFLIKALAVALPLFSIALWSRSLSSFLVGALVPGLVALTSGRLYELVGMRRHKQVWGWATAAFAVAQAAAGYLMSAYYAGHGSYYGLFAWGSLLLLSGWLLVMVSARLPQRQVQ